jgi:hypothetical protein
MKMPVWEGEVVGEVGEVVGEGEETRRPFL